MESFQNRPAADTIIVNCQLSIVNSAKPLNSNFTISLLKPITTKRIIYVDKETGVNYLYFQNGFSGGLTPLLDAEGKPLVTKQ